MLCLDVLFLSMNLSETKKQLRLHSYCKKFYENLIITHISNHFSINDEIIKHSKYGKIVYLNIGRNSSVKDIGHLTHLTYLNCNYGIPDENIKNIVNLTHI